MEEGIHKTIGTLLWELLQHLIPCEYIATMRNDKLIHVAVNYVFGLKSGSLKTIINSGVLGVIINPFHREIPLYNFN